MGFVSFDCACCGHPMLSPHAVKPVNSWMNNVVIVTREGDTHVGKYDGYGRVMKREGPDYDIFIHAATSSEVCAYHLDCWNSLGRPLEFVKSKRSEDQGYFFAENAHDMPRPTGAAQNTQ